METSEQQVDLKSAELIEEFSEHIKQYAKLHPEQEAQKDEIFQGWIIQKIAGLQLSILEIANSINKFIARYEQEKGKS